MREWTLLGVLFLGCFTPGEDEGDTTFGEDEVEDSGTDTTESETESDTETETTEDTETETTETDAPCMVDADCYDQNACTEDACDTGTCVNMDISAMCDDLDVCTTDSCDMAMGCISEPMEVIPDDQAFAATGQVQMFEVPACVTSIRIVAEGAQGGTEEGGKGARMAGTFAVTPGEQLQLVVGSQGVINTCNSGGGGGGSYVWRPADATEPLIAAGGGGGGNSDWGELNCRKGLDANVSTAGISGNGPLSAPGGANGNGGSGIAPEGVGGGGAGWKSNGGDSTFVSPAGGGKAPPSFAGGVGGPSFSPGGQGGFGGGGGAVCGCGGGGGYSGGGAGEGQSCRAGGGGGGSFNAGTDPMAASGVGLGDGEVVISWGI
jgi:hypothetical protein